MRLKLLLLNRIGLAYQRASQFLARRWQRKFYWYLATFFTLFALMDTVFLHLTSEIRTATFDPMVRYRLLPPSPDPDIVIVDINESSLSAMSKEYGRWPWPRRVLGDFVDKIEKQHPKAIVFDILFSDADVFNPSSDAQFDASIAKTNNTFFPMLLLGEAGDKLRQVRLNQVPGVLTSPDEEPEKEVSVNLILPHFQAAINGGRLGTQNVLVDSDGVVRNYPVDSYTHGWRIPSLAARLGREFGWTQPSTDHMLLNWRGAPYSYQYVSFSEIYQDLSSEEKLRPANEFTGKIVLIGSTAPNLYDVRATPMSEMHPGVEVLATAIDNYKHGDSLRFPEGRVWYLLITLSLIWLTAWAFHREDGRGHTDSLFSLSQFILIGFSFASINFGNTYINLAGPVMIGIAFFSIARLYARATENTLANNMVRAAQETRTAQHARLLLLRFNPELNLVSKADLNNICLALQRVSKVAKSVEVISGEQKGLWGLLENTIAVSWLCDANDQEMKSALEVDAQKILTELPVLLQKFLLNLNDAVSLQQHQGLIQGGEYAPNSWRALLASALLQAPTAL